MTRNNKTYLDDTGMSIKQYIKENDVEYLLVKHKVGNTFLDSQYREYFKKLKESGRLINDSYDDEKWVCFKDKDSATIILSFPFEMRHEVNEAVKNYVLTKIYVQRSALRTVKKRLRDIIHFMQDTAFMCPDNVKDYQITISTWNENKKREIFSVKEFLEFSNLENADLYYDVLKNIKGQGNNFRSLPDFKSILIFDKIVNDYWSKVKNQEDRYRLFPIILWWKLTTVIPTRPVELFNLKRNCTYEQDGRFYFTIERQKTELDKSFILGDIVTNFEINEELYSLIHDYADYCNSIDDCKYLLSPPTCDVIYRNKILNTRQKFTSEKMNNYYKVFETEIVEGQYKYRVVKSHNIKEGELPHICYGDTRHLAIINMMLQGVNPIYIAQLAGHHSLDIQMGYYSHLETFATAKSYALKQFMTMNSQISKNHLEQDARNATAILKKELSGAEFYLLPEVAGGQGRCSSKNIPYECSSKGCLFCRYFLPEHITEDCLVHYQEENERDINMIKKELKVLLGQNSCRDDTAIKQNALRLGALINQKIFIDSYTYKKGEKSG